MIWCWNRPPEEFSRAVSTFRRFSVYVFVEFSTINLGISHLSWFFCLPCLYNFQYVFVISTCEKFSMKLLFASHFNYFVFWDSGLEAYIGKWKNKERNSLMLAILSISLKSHVTAPHSTFLSQILLIFFCTWHSSGLVSPLTVRWELLLWLKGL